MDQHIKKVYVPMTETAFLILLSLRQPNHGYGIVQVVDKKTNGAVRLTPGTMYGSLSKMEKDGVIRSFTITTNGRKVNKSIIAFVLLVLKYGDGMDELLEYIENDKDVLECYEITGEYDYIIKICAGDVEELDKKLLHLKKHKGVARSHTMFGLAEHKFRPTILPDMD